MSIDATDVVAAGTVGGLFAALRMLAEQPTDDVVDTYNAAMRLAYWEQKDLNLCLGLSIAGASRLLTVAAESDPQAAHGYRSAAKALVYDYASFSWPGWDETGIVTSPHEEAAGLAAARMNLALAEELDKGSLPMSRAHWMVGAHLLTSGNLDDAVKQFAAAENLATEAEAATDAALNRAYRELVGVAAGEPGADDRFDAACDSLSGVEYGADLVAQVHTARRVVDGS